MIALLRGQRLHGLWMLVLLGMVAVFCAVFAPRVWDEWQGTEITALAFAPKGQTLAIAIIHAPHKLALRD